MRSRNSDEEMSLAVRKTVTDAPHDVSKPEENLPDLPHDDRYRCTAEVSKQEMVGIGVDEIRQVTDAPHEVSKLDRSRRSRPDA